MFDRTDAFSMNIRDHDELEEKNPIVDMVTLDNQLLIFKSLGIYRALTADTIDPAKANPDTRHTYEKLYSVGANNSFVARMILQFKPILELVIPNSQLREKLLNHIWYANKILLECENAHYLIYEKTMALLPVCDEIIEKHKFGKTMPALPKIDGLEKNVEHFLNKAKQFLITTYQNLNILHDMPFSDYTNSHFDTHLVWIKDKFGVTNPIFLLINESMGWVRTISELRNAIQHPGEGQRIEMKNIEVYPGNKFSSPAWKFDLSKKKLSKQEEFSDLIYDIHVHLSNLLTFFEEVLILCLKERLKSQSFLDIYRIQKSEIRAECPIAYVVSKKFD